MEKSFAGFPRSYPDGMGEDENDALAYSPAGFIWDNALEAQEDRCATTASSCARRCAGATPQRSGTPDFLACYRTWKDKTDDVVFEVDPSIETIRPFSPTDYVGWEMAVPDQFRADFILERAARVRSERASFPTW